MSEASFVVIETTGPSRGVRSADGGAPVDVSWQAVLNRACAELAAAGVPVVHGFVGARSGTTCAGPVADERSAERAVLAALAGARLVVVATAPREVVDMLCEDLRRLGTLDHRLADAPEQTTAVGPAERVILERLLAGETLGQAAAALHVSRRTADRRLAKARRALRASSTAEALATAVRTGLLPPPS
jgi:DNA-binding CsgD family transcriptional regulator